MMHKVLDKRKYLLLLITLVNLILTPLYFYMLGGDSPRAIIAFNMTLILLAGYNICKSIRLPYLIIGIAVICSNLISLFNPRMLSIEYLRLIFTASFYLMIFRLTFRNLLRAEGETLDSVLGAAVGYFLIGLFGGVIFEITYYAIPNSFNFNTEYLTDFQFYYYSFTGVTTVGFGDVVPTNPQSQSISILINITAQLYLTIVMALFVGKFINNKNN